jgi:hypothetical protein
MLGRVVLYKSELLSHRLSYEWFRLIEREVEIPKSQMGRTKLLSLRRQQLFLYSRVAELVDAKPFRDKM